MAKIKPFHKRYPYMKPSRQGGSCGLIVLAALSLPVISGVVYALT